MEVLQEEKKVRQLVREQSAKVLEFEPSKLCREDLDDYSFTDIPEYATQIKRLVMQIELCSLNATPYNTLQTLASTLRSVSAQYNTIVSYDLSKTQSEEHRINIKREYSTSVREYYHQLYSVIMPILVAQFMTEGDQGKKALAVLTTEALEILEATKLSTTKTLEESQVALSKVREMYQQAGIEARAANFKELADANGFWSWVWLAAGIAVGVAIGFYLNLHFDPELRKIASLGTQHFIALSLSKLVTVSLLTYLLVACFKNYSANKHNEVVNRGKQVALSTFEQFVKGTADEPTKNAILTHACQSIFAAQTSGYLRNEPEPSHSNQIVEIVRSITGKGGT